MTSISHKQNWSYWGFWILYTIVFMGVAYKAFTVPITHDEGWTVIQYLDASVWDIMMYPDNWPNNHILNTILAKFSAGIFGVHDWSVRLPNLLFFWVYAFGVFRFLKLVLKDRMLLFVPIATLFVLSPYFLDFFGLCRGYGISSALTMLSISYFTSGYALQKSKHIWMAFAYALIASYANFTVLLYFAASCLFTAFYFVMYRKSWGETVKNLGIQIGVFVGYVWLIATPILKMKNTNQFEFWTSNGFYEETVFSVIHNSLTDSALYSNHEIFAVLVVVITVLLWSVGIWRLFQMKSLKSAFQEPLVIVGTLLFVTVGINLLQTNILGDPNLNGRTALFLLPIFLSLVACGIALFPKGNRNWISIAFGSFLMLVTVQHLGMSYRAESFKEWRYDAHTDEVISYLETNGFNQKGVDISVDWLYFNSFAFYGKYHANSHWVLFPIGPDTSTDLNTEFCYVPEEKVAEMTSLFEVVKTFEGGQTLMRRK